MCKKRMKNCSQKFNYLRGVFSEENTRVSLKLEANGFREAKITAIKIINFYLNPVFNVLQES